MHISIETFQSICSMLSEDELLKILQDDKNCFSYIPQKYKTILVCSLAIEHHSIQLKYVPDRLKTYELCSKAINFYGANMEYVPKEVQTYDLCMQAVKTYEFAICRIDDRFKTYEIYLESIKKWPLNIKYVPEEFKTFELCVEMIKNGGGRCLNDIKKFIPHKHRTSQLYMEAVKIIGRAIRHVPKKLQTLEMCIIALQHNPGNILHIKNKSEDLINYCKLMNIPYKLMN